MENEKWKMENCGGLPHCGLDPQSHPFISLNKHRDTEIIIRSKLCYSVLKSFSQEVVIIL